MNQNLRRLGYQIRRAEPDWIDFIMDRNVTTVLDIGANVGQFAELLRVKGYRGRIISFEPVSAAYQELEAKAAADDGWEVHNIALGMEGGDAAINVSDYSVFSSILPLTDAGAQFDKGANVSRADKIEVRRLDDVGIGPSGNLFIKIDTQGFEKAVLDGGRRVLAAAKGVLMELPIIHLYEGAWRLHEAIEYMFEAGFVPAQIHPVSHHTVDNMSLVEVDCLFRPRDSRLDSQL